MKAASTRLTNAKESSFSGQDPTVVFHLRKVAQTFTRLQHSRHLADYDSSTRWSRKDVLFVLDLTLDAFQSWRLIRKEPIAQDYLLSMLIKDR